MARAADRWRQRMSGFSMKNQLAMAMAKMMASRTSSVGQYDQWVPLGWRARYTGECTR